MSPGGRSVLDPDSKVGAGGTDSYPWKVLCVTTLGSLLVFINSTSVNVALPAVSADFAVPAATADWILLSFMLALTTMILVFSRLSDLLGRRRLYLGGLLLMTVASLGAAFTVEPVALIILRSLQGVAAASTITNANGMIADAFPHRLLAVGLSINIMMASVASMLGPVLGGVLLEHFGWRSLFLVNVPFGLLGLLLGQRVLRAEPARRPGNVPFDYAGAVLSALALALLLVGINRLSAWGWQDGRPLAILAGAAVALAAFVLVERRLPEPLVDFALIRDRARGLAYATAFFMSLAQASVLVLVVLYQQMILGASPTETGVIAAVGAGALMLASPLAGQLARVLTPRTVATAGSLIALAGFIALLLSLTGTPGGTLLVTALILIGVGNGIFTAPNTAAIIGGLPVDKRGISNGIRSVLFNSAQTMGTALVLLIIGQWLAGAGIDGYDARVSEAEPVIGGFRLAAGLLILCAAAAVGCSAARGGPWARARKTTATIPEGVIQ